MIPTSTIPVNRTRQNTIQGEGFWSGSPVDFIELSGCPVGCFFCDSGDADSEQTTPRNFRTIAELVDETRSPRVVISGGEPFIHPNLNELVVALMAAGKLVSIETSGAFWQEMPYSVWITLSPKEHLNSRYPVKPQFWDRANEIKLVISQGDEIDFYWHDLSINMSPYVQPSVYLQPEWEGRDRTVPLTLRLLQRHPYCKLSLQLHKLIGLV